MSYFAEPNHIEYDAWFDENIDPVDLVNYSDEKEFSDWYTLSSIRCPLEI